MLFHVLGIKEIGWKNYNLDFLIEKNSEKELRTYLSWLWVVVLNIEKYTWLAINFWITQLIIEDNEQHFPVIIQSTDYRKGYLLFSLVWFHVQTIESLDTDQPINPEKLQQDIVKWNILLEKLHTINEKKAKHQHEQQEIELEDHQITEMQLLSSQVIQRANTILTTMIDDISSQEKKKLEDLTQELSKVKLGTNIEKMKAYANQMIVMINDIEKRQINKLTDFQQSLFQWSVVTNIDVAKEVKKYEKAEDIKRIWGIKTTTDSFYISLGKIGLYIKFLRKDFLYHLTKYQTLIVNVFQFVQTILFIVIVWMGIYLSFLGKNTFVLSENIVMSLLQIAVLNWLLLIVSYFAKKRYFVLFLWFVIAFFLCQVILMIIKNTLSL